MKRLSQIVIFLFMHSVFAQVDYSSSWEDFFSYNNVKDFIKKDNKIYAIVENALFTYTTTEEMVKISSINGLSGENTASIYYSNLFDKVIIGYETGLLEIIDNKNNITIAKGIVAFNSSVSSYGDRLSEVYAYRNPSTKANEFITIDGRNGTHLPNGTNVKFLDAAGNLVYETNTNEGNELFGGKVVWNKANLTRNKVASGIYIVLLITEDNTETTAAKIAIIN